MRVDIHTVPGVVVLRDDRRIIASAPTMLSLKREVSIMLERRELLSVASVVDELGNLTNVKDWCRV